MSSNMEDKIQRLIEMGASRARARHALRQTPDVMEAAQDIWDGRYDDIQDYDGDVEMQNAESSRSAPRPSRLETPPDGSDDEAELEDDEAADDEVVDYDSEPDFEYPSSSAQGTGHDPYTGIFFSKDRKEEVIEVIETPEIVTVGNNIQAPIMTQGEWMKGCPEGGEQGFLFQLYSKISNEPSICPDGNCAQPFPPQKTLFFAIWPRFSDYTRELRKHVQHKCTKCSIPFCLACSDKIDPQKASQPSYDPLLHCSDLQGVILGVGLSMVERLYNQDTVDQDPMTRKRKTTPSESTSPVDDEDDEMPALYGQRGGKRAKGGTGYAGSVREDMTGHDEAMRQQQARDKQLGELLKEVRVFLPSLNRPGGAQTCDLLVHPTALAHLRRRFNTVGSSLLRNDSLSDMSDRHVVYFELFEWFQTISGHEALSSMMGMPIMVVASTSMKTSTTSPEHNPSKSGVRRTKAGSSSVPTRERVILYEGSSGPRELMESIVIQAQAAIKGLGPSEDVLQDKEKTEEEKRKTTDFTRSRLVTLSEDAKGKGKAVAPPAEDNTKLRTFCERIITTAAAVDRSLRETKGDAFIKRLQDSLPKVSTISTSLNHPSSSVVDSYTTAYDSIPVGKTPEENEANYIKWAQSIRFEYCDLTLPTPPGGAVKSMILTPTVPTPKPAAAPSSNSMFSFSSVTSQAQSQAPAATAPTPANPKVGQVPDDGPPNYLHAYNGDIRMLANADIPKRSLAIAKELATLTTNLPVAYRSSVFLRVDETRVDVIKAMIIGPADTPYENGCFLFDIFLGPNYNQSPPAVKYMTTHGGKFRFNPNLYAEGKVCLSLLGTWDGPGWIAGKSTLLQVLISIQSMILNEEPYLNEPGWAGSGGTPQSKAYSMNCRRMTVKAAILGNLEDPPRPFADVIRTHFRLKADHMRAQLDKWLSDDDKQRTDGAHSGSAGLLSRVVGFNDMGQDVEKIKVILDKLTAIGAMSADSSSSH